MQSVRRWYIYIVAAVSLQSVTWALILLLRELLISGGRSRDTLAFTIAVIVVGLPVFLTHWRWAQRLSAESAVERGAAVRALYLYGSLAAFLGPALAELINMLTRWLETPFGRQLVDRFEPYTVGEETLRHIVALLVLAIFWLYHYRQLGAPPPGLPALIRRFYIYVFSFVGLSLIAFALNDLVRWLLFQTGSVNVIRGLSPSSLPDTLAWLTVGLGAWLIFWQSAQRLYRSGAPAERVSALRKFYLYAIVFIGILTAVTNATLILAGTLQTLLGVPVEGDVRGPLSLILVALLLWAYHSFVVRADAAMAAESRQAQVRRLYLYLMALVGLAALLVGVGSIVNVIIRLLTTDGFGTELRQQLAWATAATIAGLPVWLLPWRRVQGTALQLSPNGAAERSSIVRKIYLYFYLLVATLTVLSGAIYVLARLVSRLLGEPDDGTLFSDIAQALAFAMIGVLVWLYHGWALRQDQRLGHAELSQRLAQLRVALLFGEQTALAARLRQELADELPGLAIETATDAASEEGAPSWETADVIVSSLDALLQPALAARLQASAARKVVLPLRRAGWEWAGVERWTEAELIAQSVAAVRQLIDGEEVDVARSLGIGALVAIAVGVLLLVALLVVPLLRFIA